ncbi:rRNA 2'-O-methyltransferase fibrillarin-like [Macrobrachium nipponense]|uniref:rRNA 2'-O-methyltransferase fibrillarin-like n=1 Tax=Macrobrachium nipponense TaxID=159736 RepID=UPI0030C85F00
MTKLALVFVLFAATSLIDAHGPPCAATDNNCRCTRILEGALRGGGLGHGGGGHGGRKSWGGGGGRWGGEAGQYGGGRKKRHGGRGEGMGGRRGQDMTDCANEVGVTVPPRPEWGVTPKPELPDALRNCLIRKGLERNSLLTTTGEIKQTELVTSLTGSLTNNRWDPLTADQVTAITNEVPACDTSTKSQTNNFLLFQNCLVTKCTTTLTAG